MQSLQNESSSDMSTEYLVSMYKSTPKTICITLKHQYVHNLKDQYYGTIARKYMFTSPKEQSFTQFQGQLALTFWKTGKKDTKAYATTTVISGKSLTGANRGYMSHNS